VSDAVSVLQASLLWRSLSAIAGSHFILGYKKNLLEIKDTAANSGEEVFARAVDVLIQTIEEYNMQDRVSMVSFDDNVVSYFRERTEEQIMTGSGMFRSIVFTVMSTLKVDFFFKPVDAALFLPIRDEIKEPHLSTVRRVPGFLRNNFFVYGYQTTRQTGSHLRLTTDKNGIHHITIPNHDPLKNRHIEQYHW
jgi:glycerophosphoryl diester phosphodiesterase